MLNVTDVKRIHAWEPMTQYHLPGIVVAGAGRDSCPPVTNSFDAAVFDVGGLAHAPESVHEYTQAAFTISGTVEDWFAGDAGEYKWCINHNLEYVPAGFRPYENLPFCQRFLTWQRAIAVHEILMPERPQIDWVKSTVAREQDHEPVGVTYSIGAHELANFVGGVGATVPLLNSTHFEGRPVEWDATPEITGNDRESDDISVGKAFLDKRLRSDSTETAKTAKTPEKTATDENAVGAVGAKWKSGDRVRIIDHSEAHGCKGTVLYEQNGVIIVGLDETDEIVSGTCWPVTEDHESEALEVGANGGVVYTPEPIIEACQRHMDGTDDVRLPKYKPWLYCYVWPDNSRVVHVGMGVWTWDKKGERGSHFASPIAAARDLYAAGGARWYQMPEAKKGLLEKTVYKFADGSEVRNYQAGSDEWFWVNGSDYTSKHYDLKLQDFPSPQLAADDLYRNGGAR